MDKTKELAEFLEGLPDDELISINNEYCNKTNSNDRYAYDMAQFDEQNQGNFTDIFDRLYDKANFRTDHSYFWYYVYGIKSGYASDAVSELVYPSELAAHIIDNAHEYRGINDELDEYLDELEG